MPLVFTSNTYKFQDTIGFTPLFIAVTAGNLEVIKLLIEKGTQLDHTDLDKHTVAHWAVVCGQLEALQELIKCGAPISTPDLHVSSFGAF